MSSDKKLVKGEARSPDGERAAEIDLRIAQMRERLEHTRAFLGSLVDTDGSADRVTEWIAEMESEISQLRADSETLPRTA